MDLIWKFAACVGGRNWDEVNGRPAGDCDTSIAVGMMSIVSIGIIFAGHLLFWGHLPHTASLAWPIAVFVAILFALMYRVLLRAMETMGWFAKATILIVLVAIMGINAALAGHELVLLAFKPQVENQANLNAANGITTYMSAVETSLGLPQLRTQSKQLEDAIGSAQADRLRIPDGVLALQRQSQSCELLAANLRARIPGDKEEPGYAAAMSSWREQRVRCAATTAQASKLLQDHRMQTEQQLSSLSQQRTRVQQSLADANTQHEDTLKRDAPTLNASATTGFARHAALWSAVDAGRIPVWAAYGLMFIALALDAFSFLIKMLAKTDTATTDRKLESEATALFNRLRSAKLSQQRALVRSVVKTMKEESERELNALVKDVVAPSIAQELEGRAFSHAATAIHRAQETTKRPIPSMIQRLVRMADAIHRRSNSAFKPASATA